MSSSPQFAAAQLGAPAPICYGYVRGLGNNVLLQELSDKSRVAFILLGQGEWDGMERFWTNIKLINVADMSLIHFHPGVEGTLGRGLAPESDGGNQYVDNFWSYMPTNIQRVTFSRWAYVALHVPPDPAAPGPELSWLGDYRALKVRQFAADGTQTAYAFSTNPAWQIADLILRSVLKRGSLANEALTAAEKARFDFAAMKDSADWCDADIGGGIKRMETSIVFADRQNLAQRIDQMKTMSQLYVIEDAGGKIYIRADKARAYTFLLTSDHILPGSFQVEKRNLRGAANRHIGHFNDLNLRQVVAIAAISRAANVVTVQTSTVHPFLANDAIAIGDVAPASFNGDFVVSTVPDNTHFTYAQTGANEAGAGGKVGTPESRFAQRAPIIDHKQNQLATGTRGVGLATIRRRLPEDIDYGNNTWERVRRLMRFRSQRNLGLDSSAYAGPRSATVKAWFEAVDGANNILVAQQRGDIIRIDKSISEEHQGDYEIIDTTQDLGDAAGGNPANIELTLFEYLSDAFSDSSNTDTVFSPAQPRTGLRSIVQVDGSGNTLVEAGDVLYTGGATVDSLKPAEAGAEQTTGKSLTVLVNRTADNIAETGSLKWAAEHGAELNRMGAGNLVKNGAFELGDTRNWRNADREHNAAFTDPAWVASDSGSREGGNIAYFSGDIWVLTSKVIPVDPYKRYYMEVRLARSGAAATNFYAGFACFDKDKNLIPNPTGGTFNYNLAENLATPVPWTVYSAVTTPGEEAGPPFSDKTKMRVGTKYICPLLLLNRDAAGGATYVDYFKIVEIDSTVKGHPRVSSLDDAGALDFSLTHRNKTTDYILPTTARDFIDPDYIDGFKRPISLRRPTSGDDLSAESIFKRGQHSLADVLDDAGGNRYAATADEKTGGGRAYPVIAVDGTYKADKYHASAFRRITQNTRFGTTGSSIWTTVNTFPTLHIPANASSYRGSVHVAANGIVVNGSARLKVGSNYSNIVTDTVGGTDGTLTVTGLTGDTDITVELQAKVNDVQCDGVGATFYQDEYVDQNSTNV